MSDNITFELKGFISVKFFNSTLSLLMTPDQAYLSPCKKYAVGFQFGENPNAMLFEINEGGKVILEVKDNPNWLSHLVNIALAQKPVLLNIDKTSNIVGFTFPVN